MKKLLTYLTIALSLIVGLGTNVRAEQSSPQVTVSLTEERDIQEQSPWGWRIPAVPINRLSYLPTPHARPTNNV